MTNLPSSRHSRGIPIGNADPSDFSAFPDFLIIGPQRTGTTWLYHNLKQHPQIFLPRVKETYFFSTLGQPNHPQRRFETLEDYLRVMRDSPRRFAKKTYDSLRKFREFYRPAVRGEATATYAKLTREVIEQITEINPNIRAILMLRDPVERALSHAKKDLARNRGRALEDIPTEEFARFFRGKGQLQMASYSEVISRWQSCLEPGHLFFGHFDNIAAAPAALLTQIHQFLEVRAGPRYFGKHLRERINPTADGDVSDEVRQLAREILRENVADYRQVIDSRVRRRTEQPGDLALPV